MMRWRESFAQSWTISLYVFFMGALFLLFDLGRKYFTDFALPSRWQMQWLHLLVVSILLGVSGAIAFWYDRTQAQQIRQSFQPCFSATSQIYCLGIGLFLAGAYMFLVTGRAFWCVMACVLYLHLLARSPHTIRLTPAAITQRNRWGRLQSIPYKSVETIVVTDDGATVTSGNGLTIEHTPDHPCADRFRELLANLTGKPINGPGGQLVAAPAH